MRGPAVPNAWPGRRAELRDLAERLADPDPGRRPVSADAALADLAVHGGSPGGREPRRPMPFEPDPPTAPTAESVGPRRRRPLARRSRMLAIGAVGAARAGGAGGGLSGGVGPRSATAPRRDAGAARPPRARTTAARPSDEPAPTGDGGPGVPAPTGEPDVAQAAALNDEGFALIRVRTARGGRALLERAVSLFPEGTGDINYAFALFNLGQALNDAGRPDEAIPVLRERLEIPEPDRDRAVRA